MFCDTLFFSSKPAMMDLTFYKRCIQTLHTAHQCLMDQSEQDISYDLYRSACIKEFEIILEQSGKLLRKALLPWLASRKELDRLNFKDVFRRAAKHSLIGLEEAERWLQYRDNRNETSHDYGVQFAEKTLTIIPQFIADANALATVLEKLQGEI